MNGDEKFERESLPIILATIQRARESSAKDGEKAKITIHIAENGGMDTLTIEKFKKVK